MHGGQSARKIIFLIALTLDIRIGIGVTATRTLNGKNGSRIVINGRSYPFPSFPFAFAFPGSQDVKSSVAGMVADLNGAKVAL